MSRELEKHIAPRALFRSSFLPSIWDEIEDRLGQWGGDSHTGVSVSEDGQHVYVEAQLPGLKPEEIDISLDKNTLWIKGEKKENQESADKKYYRRARSSFLYQVDFPCQIEENSEKTHYQDGVLTLSFTKARQNQVRKISVKQDQEAPKKK